MVNKNKIYYIFFFKSMKINIEHRDYFFKVYETMTNGPIIYFNGIKLC